MHLPYSSDRQSRSKCLLLARPKFALNGIWRVGPCGQFSMLHQLWKEQKTNKQKIQLKNKTKSKHQQPNKTNQAFAYQKKRSKQIKNKQTQKKPQQNKTKQNKNQKTKTGTKTKKKKGQRINQTFSPRSWNKMPLTTAYISTSSAWFWHQKIKLIRKWFGKKASTVIDTWLFPLLRWALPPGGRVICCWS